LPLRARVGRHARTGAQCQNWADDQQKVISLLNAIPAPDGGAAGTINGRVVAGIASDQLYAAILRFQKKHFGAQQTGFIEFGAQLTKLEALVANLPTASAAPAASPAGQWGEFKSGSVPRALHKALADDGYLNHVEVVEILRATLANGTVSKNELDDLKTVASKSRNILPRSRKMLETFVDKVNATSGGGGQFRLPLEKHQFAANTVCDFMRRMGQPFFPHLDRDEVGIGLLLRIARPGLLNQGEASLCGPAALMFGLAADNPLAYVVFARDLYEKGQAKLYRLTVEPGKDCRTYAPSSGAIDPVDWLTMASIRDSENYLLDYDTVDKQVAGITTPGELARWFSKSGYSDVRDQTNLKFSKGVGTIDDANRLFEQGYRICLFISANMLKESEQADEGSVLTRHWVIQRSPIDRTNGKVKLQVFSWGEGSYQIPNGATDLPLSQFIDNFYGFVAAKPY
jgi:hypothetical protein